MKKVLGILPVSGPGPAPRLRPYQVYQAATLLRGISALRFRIPTRVRQRAASQNLGLPESFLACCDCGHLARYGSLVRKALRLVPQGQPRRSPLRGRTESAREFGPSPMRIPRVGSGRDRNGFKPENPSRVNALANPRTRADNKSPNGLHHQGSVNHSRPLTLAACDSGSPGWTRNCTLAVNA